MVRKFMEVKVLNAQVSIATSTTAICALLRNPLELMRRINLQESKKTAYANGIINECHVISIADCGGRNHLDCF